jgi:hypothetical protein
MDDQAINWTSELKVGDWVMVRSAEEVLATLDSNARLEEIPFMPEMLRCCGKKYRVRARAHKLCDTAFGTGGRQLTDSVFLDDIRCMGEDYGGCEMRCSIVWKGAWLRRSSEADQEVAQVPAPQLDALVRSSTRRATGHPVTGEPIYVCQGTQMPHATVLLPWWKPRQYLEDIRSGNAALGDIVTRLAFLVYAALEGSGLGFGSALRWAYDRIQLARGGKRYPIRPGRLPIGGPTPTATLGLKVGDYVRVKSPEQILATVDELLVNRGMAFHPELIASCDKTFKVTQRVQRLINEKTGLMQELKNSCVVLEGAACVGRYTRPLNCPRACPPYWREIWLERAELPSSGG